MATYVDILTPTLSAVLALIILYYLARAHIRRRGLAPLLGFPPIFPRPYRPSRRKVVIRSPPSARPAILPLQERGRSSKNVIIRSLSQDTAAPVARSEEGYCCLCGDVAGPQHSLRFGLPQKCRCGRIYHSRCIRWAKSIRRQRCRCGKELPGAW